MKIKLLASWAGFDFSFVPGDVVDVSEETGVRMIERGLAIAFIDKTKRKK